MNIGDKVVCIDVSANSLREIYLTFGKEYIINIVSDIVSDNVIYIFDDSGAQSCYYAHRFITLPEMRRIKLNKLENIVSNS